MELLNLNKIIQKPIINYLIKRKIDSCESTDYIIEPNYHFIQTNTNYDKLNKIIERISNYDNPDKSNILQKSIINQLPRTGTD